MNVVVRILVFTALFVLVFPVDAQRILLLEKPGKFRNYKYFVGDDIVVKTFPYDQKHKGTIHEITDTSIIINFDYVIMLEDIKMVMKQRWGWPRLSVYSRFLGAGYFVLDVTNRAINGQDPMIDVQTALISGGLVAFGYALVPLHYKRMRRGEKWRLKVLNMSMDEEVPNPFRR